jgi:hypothetical protein
MAVMWWLCVPFNIGLAALSLIMGFGPWAIAHILGLFFLLAYLTGPLSLVWSVVMLVRLLRGRNATRADVAMLGAVPVMVALWIIALKT